MQCLRNKTGTFKKVPEFNGKRSDVSQNLSCKKLDLSSVISHVSSLAMMPTPTRQTDVLSKASKASRPLQVEDSELMLAGFAWHLFQPYEACKESISLSFKGGPFQAMGNTPFLKG